jgi:hypothetical protein
MGVNKHIQDRKPFSSLFYLALRGLCTSLDVVYKYSSEHPASYIIQEYNRVRMGHHDDTSSQ